MSQEIRTMQSPKMEKNRGKVRREGIVTIIYDNLDIVRVCHKFLCLCKCLLWKSSFFQPNIEYSGKIFHSQNGIPQMWIASYKAHSSSIFHSKFIYNHWKVFSDELSQFKVSIHELMLCEKTSKGHFVGILQKPILIFLHISDWLN